MKGILKAYVRFSNAVVSIGGYVAGILIFLISVMVFYEIVARSVFNAPTIWANELSVYALIGSGLLGAGYTLVGDGHIRVDVVLERVSDRTSRILHTFTYFLGLIFALVLLIYGVELVAKTYLIGLTSASLLRVPMYIPYLLIPVGSTILVLAFIQKIITTLNPELNPHSEKKGGAN